MGRRSQRPYFSPSLPEPLYQNEVTLSALYGNYFSTFMQIKLIFTRKVGLVLKVRVLGTRKVAFQVLMILKLLSKLVERITRCFISKCYYSIEQYWRIFKGRFTSFFLCFCFFFPYSSP